MLCQFPRVYAILKTIIDIFRRFPPAFGERGNSMKKKELLAMIMEEFDRLYPDAECSLTYEKPYELLFATRLSAQCTDARVNIVTKELYAKYPTLESLAEAPIEDIEQIVHPCGFFRQKAKNIVETSQILLEKYDGKLPDTVEELIKLPGVGRKTANLIVGDVFGKPSVVADTHCIRLSNRFGFCKTEDPYQVELALRKILPPERSGRYCHQTVLHGRALCTARSPKCAQCPMNSYCPFGLKELEK